MCRFDHLRSQLGDLRMKRILLLTATLVVATSAAGGENARYQMLGDKGQVWILDSLSADKARTPEVTFIFKNGGSTSTFPVDVTTVPPKCSTWRRNAEQ
jgi:hypothetical protein